MKGKVYFWKRDFNNPKNTLFGWGFIMPNGCSKACDRVYFNETRLPEGVEVRSGDRVEFTLFKPNGKYTSLAAKKVEKVNDEKDQAQTSGPLHQAETIVTIPGELEANFD